MFPPLFFEPSARFVTKRKGQSKSTAEMNGAPTLPNIKESPDGETPHSPRGLPRAESNPTIL
jgi:hypothetical protein